MPLVIGITNHISKEHYEWDLPEKNSELNDCMWGAQTDFPPHLFKIERNNQGKLI